MSYILDALRRAEAERQRGAVPGLHAQSAPAAAPAATSVPRWPLLAAAGAALLLGGAVAAWWLGRSGGPPAAAESASAEATAPAAPRVNAAPPPSAVAIAPPAVAPAVPPAAPPAVAAAPAAPPQLIVMVTPNAPPVAPGAVVVAVPPPSATGAAASAPARVPRLAELPDAVRATLPPLTLGGIVHASAPAQRLVILGGQVFHEGERPLPDLQVQEIRPRSVVLDFRGQAFELGP